MHLLTTSRIISPSDVYSQSFVFFLIILRHVVLKRLIYACFSGDLKDKISFSFPYKQGMSVDISDHQVTVRECQGVVRAIRGDYQGMSGCPLG